MHEWILTEPLPELIFSLKHHSPTTYLVREGKYPLTKHSPKIFDTESRYVFDATSLQDLYQRFIEVSSTDRKETHQSNLKQMWRLNKAFIVRHIYLSMQLKGRRKLQASL